MDEKTRFKKLLKEMGLTYRELAGLLNCSESRVKNAMKHNEPMPRWGIAMLFVAENYKKNIDS